METRISSDIAPGIHFRVTRLDLTVSKIVSHVAREFDVSKTDIMSPSISRSVTEARQVVHLFILLLPGYTLKQTGKEIGGRDHSSVIYSIKTVIGLYDTNPNYRSRINSIRSYLNISESTFKLHLIKWRKQ